MQNEEVEVRIKLSKHFILIGRHPEETCRDCRVEMCDLHMALQRLLTKREFVSKEVSMS